MFWTEKNYAERKRQSVTQFVIARNKTFQRNGQIDNSVLPKGSLMKIGQPACSQTIVSKNAGMKPGPMPLHGFVLILVDRAIPSQPAYNASMTSRQATRFRARWRLAAAAERAEVLSVRLPVKLLQTASLMASAACLRPPTGREREVQEVRGRWWRLRRALRA